MARSSYWAMGFQRVDLRPCAPKRGLSHVFLGVDLAGPSVGKSLTGFSLGLTSQIVMISQRCFWSRAFTYGHASWALHPSRSVIHINCVFEGIPQSLCSLAALLQNSARQAAIWSGRRRLRDEESMNIRYNIFTWSPFLTRYSPLICSSTTPTLTSPLPEILSFTLFQFSMRIEAWGGGITACRTG